MDEHDVTPRPDPGDDSTGDSTGDRASGAAADVRLVEALHDAFDDDLASIPADLTRFALDALQWRVIDDELATLTFDSRDTELIGIRGTTTSQRHALRFEGRGIAASISFDGRSLVASIEPAGIYRCRIEGPRVVVVISTDEQGQMAAECALPVRVVIETPAGSLFGPWVTG